MFKVTTRQERLLSTGGVCLRTTGMAWAQKCHCFDLKSLQPFAMMLLLQNAGDHLAAAIEDELPIGMLSGKRFFEIVRRRDLHIVHR